MCHFFLLYLIHSPQGYFFMTDLYDTILYLKQNIVMNTIPSHSFVTLLKMKPVLHSQRYDPTRFTQPWSPHTLPVRHSSTSIRRHRQRRKWNRDWWRGKTTFRGSKMKRSEFWYKNTTLKSSRTQNMSIVTVSTFTTCAVLSKVIAPPTGDSVPATGVGSYCVDTCLARKARTNEGHTLVYI